LRSLGYRVHLHDIPAAAISNALRRHLQLSVDGDWLAAYPDPSSYIPQFFGCGGGNSIWAPWGLTEQEFALVRAAGGDVTFIWSVHRLDHRRP